MKLSDFKNLDIASLTQADVDRIAGFVQSNANRRLNYWKYRADEFSPAARSAINYLGWNNQFDIKNAEDLNAQKRELNRALNFIQDQTSTQKGWRSTQNDIINAISDATGGAVNISRKNFNDFWSAYEKAKEINPNISNKEMKYKVMDLISEYIEDSQTPEEAALNAANEYENIIKMNEENIQNAIESVSQFYSR